MSSSRTPTKLPLPFQFKSLHSYLDQSMSAFSKPSTSLELPCSILHHISALTRAPAQPSTLIVEFMSLASWAQVHRNSDAFYNKDKRRHVLTARQVVKGCYFKGNATENWSKGNIQRREDSMAEEKQVKEKFITLKERLTLCRDY